MILGPLVNKHALSAVRLHGECVHIALRIQGVHTQYF